MRLLTDLLDYQQDAVDKLSKIKVGALYMEQGTGKTRTTLSLIEPRLNAGKVEAVLWLCPCSVKRNLREDIIYHCGEFPREILIFGIESLSSSDRLYLRLMELVENEDFNGAEQYLRELFAGFDMEHVDAVVLGCTHYVFLKDMIRDMIPDRIAITEGSEGTARQLRRVLQKNELLNEQGEGRVILQTSGTEKDILLMRKLLETDKMGR